MAKQYRLYINARVPHGAVASVAAAADPLASFGALITKTALADEDETNVIVNVRGEGAIDIQAAREALVTFCQAVKTAGGFLDSAEISRNDGKGTVHSVNLFDAHPTLASVPYTPIPQRTATEEQLAALTVKHRQTKKQLDEELERLKQFRTRIAELETRLVVYEPEPEPDPNATNVDA